MKVKKLLSLLAICLLLPTLALQASAATDSGEAGDNVKWTLDNQGTLTISGSGKMVNHPWQNDYRTVIKKVVIEEGVTTICSSAFEDCVSLTEIILPESLTEIGSWALYNTGITEIRIPAGLKSIGAVAFSSCDIENVYISDLKNWINLGCGDSSLSSDNLYLNGELVTDLVVPDGVERISGSAFDYLTCLETVTIPEGVTSIGASAFYGCTNLREVKLPSTLNAIQSGVFGQCGSLTKLTIPAGVQVINSNVFAGNWNFQSVLSELRFLGDAPQIAEDAFQGINVTAYYSPNNASWTLDKRQNYSGTIEWVADESISGGDASGSIIIVDSGDCGESVTWTLSSEGLLTITGNGKMVNHPWQNDYRTVMKKVVIEEGVTTICSSAFEDCVSLTEIILPESLTEIGSWALYNTGITEIWIPAGLKSIGAVAFSSCDIENVYISDLKNWINLGCGDSSLSSDNLYLNGELVTDLVVPDGVERISGSAFDYLTCLETVTIPEGVTSIGASAFYGCTNLREVKLPTTLNAIQTGVFGHCPNLTSLTIPAGVQVINSNVFAGNWNFQSVLSELRFLGDAPLIASDGFTGITATARYSSANASWTADKLQNYGGTINWVADETIPGSSASGDVKVVDSGTCGESVTWTLNSEGLLTITGSGRMANHPWQNDYRTVIKKVVIEEGVTTICSSAFEDCVSLTEIILPESLTEIGSWALYNTGITEIKIPAGLKSIGAVAFSSCDIENVYISDLKNWINLGCGDSSLSSDNLYLNGELVTDLVVPDGVERISGSAFDYLTCLETVTIPEGVTSIGASAFYGCTNLREVKLPTTLNAIQTGVFGHCPNLTSLTIPAGVQVINSNVFAGNWNFLSILSELRFLGDAPLIASDGFSGITATARYSSANESWTADKLQNYGGTITWVADDNISDTGGSAEVYIIAEGYCGSNVYYVIYSNGEANIKAVTTFAGRAVGTYDMDDYASPEDAPWYPYRDQIKTITIEEGVTSIGDNAFAGCENLTEVIIQDGVAEVGASAFQNCENLTEITFEGSAPSFGENAFAEVNATVNYPAGDSSWNQEVVEDMGGQIQLKPDENLHAHSYEQVVTPPTCTVQGYTTYTCACGKTYHDDFVDPVDHSYGAPAYVWDQDNSCTAEFICTVCEDKQSVACNVVSTPAEGGTLYVATVEFGGKSYFDSRTVADAGSILWGDVNGDGWVDSFDASLIMKYDVMLIGDSDLNLAAADVSGDGWVDSYDASLILKYDVMLITKFPVEE